MRKGARNGMDSTPMHYPNKRNKIKEIIYRKYFRGPSSNIMHEQHSQMALRKCFKMERIDGGSIVVFQRFRKNTKDRNSFDYGSKHSRINRWKASKCTNKCMDS
jgi:hypothetical protein